MCSLIQSLVSVTKLHYHIVYTVAIYQHFILRIVLSSSWLVAGCPVLIKTTFKIGVLHQYTL